MAASRPHGRRPAAPAWLLAAGLLAPVAACAPQPQPSVAYMPAASGLLDPVNLVQFTAWAFAYRDRLAGKPAEAAQMVAALDSVAGVLYTSGRFAGAAPLAKLELLQARQTVRGVLGIAPGASSAAVVDSMMTVSADLARGDRAAAEQVLRPPLYTFGPERTLAILSNLPFMPQVNRATSDAMAAFGGGGFSSGSGLSGFRP
jgi:hypothetical protein